MLSSHELDWLEIKLNELKDVVRTSLVNKIWQYYPNFSQVDYFVLIEGTLTFSNKIKPMYYFENKEKFANLTDKVNLLNSLHLQHS